ncbi:hypothetical protein Agub_g7119, partial [Astrephomene gubernaculifera]
MMMTGKISNDTKLWNSTWRRWLFGVVVVACVTTRFAASALTGLALPPLDVNAMQYGGSWASANSLVFTDLMKHSTFFGTGARSAGTNSTWGYLNPALITWRLDGYPAGLTPPNRTQWCVVTTIGQGGAYYPAGRYVLLYDGDGTVELEGDAASPPVSSTAGRQVVDVTPSSTGLRVRITASNASNPVLNIRIVPAALEATYATTSVFHQDFLAMLQGIPLLRFASWMRASWNPDSSRNAPRNWTARTTPTFSSQVRESDGVAVEHLVQLANTVNANMWISLPRAANDSDPYTYGMVSYIAANLAVGLSLTVEYGTDGPGWISSHLPTNTKLISAIARRVWAAAGRPASQLRIVEAVPGAVLLGNLWVNSGSDLSYIDAIAMPASFGGSSHFGWNFDNPTGWSSGSYFATTRNLTLEYVLQVVRASVIASDVMHNKQFKILKSKGLPLLGYAAGPDMLGPLYGSRANLDHVIQNCGGTSVTWPCNLNTLYPPWTYSGGPSSISWANQAEYNATVNGILATNASIEASLETVLRQVRQHDSMYDMVLDSLWRWHYQMGGGDIVIDIARSAGSCTYAPGIRSGRYMPDECATNATAAAALIVGRPTDSPTYKALRTWLNATATDEGEDEAPNVGSLPRTLVNATLQAIAPPPKAQCDPSCVYGDCVDGECECWAGVTGDACETLGSASTPSACNQAVGVVLEGISDWSRSWTFVDVFKSSRAWIPQSFASGSAWSTGATIYLINSTDGPGGRTAVGYPSYLDTLQKVSTLVVRDLEGHVQGGWYTVLYDGKGLLDFSMSDVKDVQFVEAGYVRVRFSPSTDMNNGILVVLERTDPSDPLRNIRVITPGYEQAALWGGSSGATAGGNLTAAAATASVGRPFHPEFLAYLRPFGLLRFMEWMHANLEETKQPVEWEDRPRLEDRSYAVAPGGVPLELMIKLANTLGADPWFNLPYAASDDYIARFAAAVRDGLRPDLRVYVEYSNELWHTGFPGGQYAQRMGLAMNLTEEGSKWYGGATNEARLCFVGQRTANISKIWKSVWGTGANGNASRVVVVVSAQAVWPITSSKLLSCGGAASYIDALAIAPYFGSYNSSRDKNLTVFMNTTLPSQINDTLNYVAQHAAIAAKYGKTLVAYEAGQGMNGDGSSNDLAIQANRHPTMASLYRTYLRALAAANVSRVVHFSSIGVYSKYGSWGLMEAQDWDRRDAPKYQAVMEFINASKTCPLPSPPDPSTCPGHGNGCNDNGDCLPDGTCACYSGFSGPDCGTVAYTDVYNCGYRCTFDQGWCNVSTTYRTTRTWGCTCKPGLGGLACSLVACPNNCSWNGECLDQGVCSCYPGYKGADCSQDCGCGGHGRCAEDGSGGCMCDVGWRRAANGSTCEWDCSGCAPGTTCIGPGECGCSETCVYGTCFHGSCRCWAGFGGPACNISEADAAAAAGNGGGNGTGVDVVPRMNRGSLAGINLAGTAYYSSEWIWTNVMKSSSKWYTSNAADTSLENSFDTEVPLDLRPDGYPARLPPNTWAHKLMLRDLQFHAWPGRYVVLYDGDGRLDFNFDSRVVSRSKNRLEIIFTPTADLTCAATFTPYCTDNGMHLTLKATNPANPVRNIRIVPSGDGAAASAGGGGAGGAWEARVERAPFHPWFLKSVARYRVLRFMGWMSTNNDGGWVNATAQSGGAWAARTTPLRDSQARTFTGVALEHMIQLCNMVGADPWFNVHHLADDVFVTNMATLIRDTLRPDLKVYVEHSNEVWNSLFSQNAYAKQQGLALKLSNDSNVAAYRYHALRTTQIGSIFRTTFASAPGGGSSRIAVVLGGWGYLCSNGAGCGATVMKETLGWNSTASKVDYFGVTGYWSCGLGSNGATDVLLTVDAMIAKCNSTLNSTEAEAKALVTAAKSYGVPLILYEAGPSIVESAAISNSGQTAGLATKFVAVNRHPEMYRLYRSYLEAYRRAGLIAEGRPWMQFASTGLPSPYGSWGLQEYTGQPASDAPKYRAIMDWLDAQATSNATTSSPPPSPPPASSAAGNTTGAASKLLRPLCMSLRGAGGASGGVSGGAGGGGMYLGEGVLSGPPAVLLPAAGQVLVSGLTAAVRWSTAGWTNSASSSSAAVSISLWIDSDCATDPPPAAGATQQLQQRPTSQAIALVTASSSVAATGQYDWRVPLPSEVSSLAAALATAANGTTVNGGNATNGGGAAGVRRVARFFLRISDGVTTNYSEPFDIQPPFNYVTGNWSTCDCTTSPPQQRRDVTCIPSPSAVAVANSSILAALSAANSVAAISTLNVTLGVPPTPTPACGVFSNWNLTAPNIPGDPICQITTDGCRTYRTNNLGTWYYSNFKPVTDCTAQTSPWPLSAAAAAAPVSLSVCAALLAAAPPPATQACPAAACPTNWPAPLTSASPSPPPLPAPPRSPSPSAAPLASIPPPSLTSQASSPPPSPSSALPSPLPPKPASANNPTSAPPSPRPPSPSSALPSPSPPPSTSATNPTTAAPPSPKPPSPPRFPTPPPPAPYCTLSSTATAIANLNAGAATCSTTTSGQCDDGTVCTAVADCRRWSCDTVSQTLKQVACSALCLPRALTLTGASISDDGRSVVVTLSARPAALTRVAVGSVFDAASAALLGGGGALCSTTTSTTSGDAVLTVTLPANATIGAGQVLSLLPSGSALVGALNTSQSFTGSVKVASCNNCVSPRALLSGPSTLTASSSSSSTSSSSCQSTTGSLLAALLGRPTPTFDASQSTDPSGRTRWASVRWSVPSSYGTAAGRAVLQGAVDRTNALSDMNSRLRLSLLSSEEDALDEAVDFRLQVELTSWLGTAATATAGFSKPAAAVAAAAGVVPVVSIVGPAVQTARIGSALRLSAEVAGGGCKGLTLSWTWSSPSGWYGLPAAGKSGQQLVVAAPLPAVHGETISLRVTAAYINASTGASAGGSSASADVLLTVVGSAPIATLAGPSGDVPDDSTLVLNATGSYDPDDSSASLTFLWDCRRDDYPTPCFSSGDQGAFNGNGAVWTLPSGLLTSGRWYTFTVTVVKTVASGATPLNSSASVTFRPRSTTQAFPRGTLTRQCSAAACAVPHSADQDLTVLLQLSSPYDTSATAAGISVSWASAEASAVAGLTAVTTTNGTSYLLTVPAAVLPSTHSSISIAANMTVVATGVNGFAAITIALNGAPYCSLASANNSACLTVDLVNATFPTAAAKLTAVGWADSDSDTSGQQQLQYEFGVRQSSSVGSSSTSGTTTVDQIQQLGSATSATIIGLPQGVVQLYGCAIDASGSRTCGTVNVTVQPPPAGFDPTSSLAAVDVTALAQANDQQALFQAAYQMAQLMSIATTNDSSSSTSSSSTSSAVSELVANRTVALVQAILLGGALQDAQQAQQAIAAIASLAAGSASLLPDGAKDNLISAAKSAAQTLNSTTSATAATNFVTQLCQLLGVAMPTTTTTSNSTTSNSTSSNITTASGRRFRSLLDTSSSSSSSSSSAQARLQDLVSTSDQMGDALGRQAVSGGPYLAAGKTDVYASAAAIPPISAAAAGDVSAASMQISAGPNAAAAGSGSTSISSSSSASSNSTTRTTTGSH